MLEHVCDILLREHKELQRSKSMELTDLRLWVTKDTDYIGNSYL